MKRGIAGLLAGCICLCCLVRSGWAGAAEDVAVPEAAASILMEAETERFYRSKMPMYRFRLK